MDKELKEAKGMFFSDRCQFCHEFGEKIEPYLCPDCKERIHKLGYVKLVDMDYKYLPVKETYCYDNGWRKVRA